MFKQCIIFETRCQLKPFFVNKSEIPFKAPSSHRGIISAKDRQVRKGEMEMGGGGGKQSPSIRLEKLLFPTVILYLKMSSLTELYCTVGKNFASTKERAKRKETYTVQYADI